MKMIFLVPRSGPWNDLKVLKNLFKNKDPLAMSDQVDFNFKEIQNILKISTRKFFEEQLES